MVINQYPLWKYIIIIAVLLVGALYSLPNLYGEDPAVQLSVRSGAMDLSDTRIRAAEALRAGGILEVLRAVAEPREQDLEVAVWFSDQPEPYRITQTVSPQPDKLLRLHVDLTRGERPVQFVQTTLEGSQP